MVKEPSNSSILEELHEDEKEIRRFEKGVRIILIFVSIFILILLAGVSYLVIQSATNKNPIIKTDITYPSTSPEVTDLLSPTPTFVPFTSTEEIKKSSVKDHYINLGSGTNQSSDWTDVSGALTTADIGQYPDIKEVHFEAFINVPTANGSVSVRLFNKTNNYSVSNSEIIRDGTVETYHFISPLLIYDVGPKLYQVQMKSQLNVLANLVSARIHIVTE